MFEMNLQLFGGRGAKSGNNTGGIDDANVVKTDSLISAREDGKQNEVDQTLTVLRDIQDRYGVNVSDVHIATIQGRGARTMAYYDSAGNLAVNKSYFNAQKMDAAYDRCVSNGFHPSRGSKTGLEATVAHEMGHRLTDVAGQKSGAGAWALDVTSDNILKAAAKATGHKSTKSLQSKISGYAKVSAAEAVAEAFSDVYCNGSKAARESRAVVAELNKYFS